MYTAMPILVRDSTNNKNVMLQVDGSNQVSVKDSANGLTLTSINSALAGTLAVSDSTAQTKLVSIASALAGTLTVSEGVSRSSATLTNAASVTANDYTSAVDCNSHRKIAVYGTSSISTQQLKVFVSDDSSNWYEHTDQAFYANAANGNYYRELDCVNRYIKLQYDASATETTKYTLMN